MVALVQRVKQASVTVQDETVGQIGAGLLVLLGVHERDTEAESRWLANKCARLRIFPDDDGRMDRSVMDVGGEVLVVPQFTLYGDATQGNRPSFTAAAPPDRAASLYDHFVDQVAATLGHPVPTGVFGAMMDVQLINDGPVTLWVERLPE